MMSSNEVVRTGMRTPWGTADSATVMGPGIGSVGTPGHGGVKLDAAHNRLVPKPLRREGGWYEEDCDVYIPLYVLYDELPETMRSRYTRQDLLDGMNRWYPEQVAAAYPQPPEPPKPTREADYSSIPMRDDSQAAQEGSPTPYRAPEMSDAEAQAVLDSEKCGPCKGLGLVRAVGKNAGKPYRTLNGAQAALAGGRAVDCPTCKGLGLTGLAV